MDTNYHWHPGTYTLPLNIEVGAPEFRGKQGDQIPVQVQKSTWNGRRKVDGRRVVTVRVGTREAEVYRDNVTLTQKTWEIMIR